MITILNCYKGVDGERYDFVGLSTDTKPSGDINGSSFFEMDTNRKYIYDAAGDTWFNTGRTMYATRCTIAKQPTNKSYTEGDSFNPTGLQIDVSTSNVGNETSATPTHYDWTSSSNLEKYPNEVVFSNATSLEVGQTKIPVTVNFRGQIFNVEITGLTVTAAETPGEG